MSIGSGDEDASIRMAAFENVRKLAEPMSI